MKLLRLLVELPIRFIFALLAFTFLGPIGWLGIILVLLRFFGVRVEPLIESFYASTISPTVPAGRASNHQAVSRPLLRVRRYNGNLG
jgi:hypothetical protein